MTAAVPSKRWVSGAFLRSVVGRRIFALFLLSAFVPVVVLAVLSYQLVQQTVTESAQKQLIQETRAHGRAFFDRLLGARLLLNAHITHQSTDVGAQDNHRSDFKGVFRQVVLRTAQAPDFPRLDAPVQAHLAQGEAALLIEIARAPLPPSVWMVQALASGSAAGELLMAQIDLDYLWGKTDELLADIHLCVLTADEQVLWCSDPQLAGSAIQVARAGAGTQTVTVQDWLANRSSVFLRAEFALSDWSVVAFRPRAVALKPLSHLEQTLVGLIVLTLLLVALLSVAQIRRTLVPLERLMAGTRRIAREQFDQPVEVPGNDEFGRLARSLNTMASRLGRQIRAMQALAGIDQQILSRLDIAQIVERVQGCVLELVPQAWVGVLLSDPVSEDLGLWYLRSGVETGQAQTRDMQQTLRLADYAGMRDGVWLDGTDHAVSLLMLDQPGFQTAYCFVLPLTVRDTVVGLLLIGVQGEPHLPDDALAQVRDLGGRIGVALAAHAHELQLVHLARHDRLTGLPNRLFLEEHLQQALAHAKRHDEHLAVLFIDLDHFKNINDTLGHTVGDHLLMQVAARLRTHVRDSDTVARLGGDEFVVLQSGLQNAKHASKQAEALLQALAQPFDLDGHESFVGGSIGVAVYPTDGDNVTDLLKHADIAMYRAKRSGRGCLVFFEDRMNDDLRSRTYLLQELHQALERQQLMVYYQPRVRLSDARVVGAEALLRWQHPELGFVSPAQFIPLAEESGLIGDIGHWVLRAVCQQLAQWVAAGYKIGSVAVNVSGRQLRRSDLVGQVTGALQTNNLPSNLLEIEVTEGVLIENIEQVIDMLRQLRGAGISISLDDFGTGYSSMTYLRHLPFDVLKIDQAFVRELSSDDSAHNIVRAVVALAHALNKTLVAEGVELSGQADLLRNMGCEEAQGFLYSRPVPAAEFEKLLQRQGPLPAG